MTFEFLLRAVGRLLRQKQQPWPELQGAEVESAECYDTENPFPEVITIEFEDVLDLHSIPPGQVRAVIEDYVAEAQRRGVMWVRIIHGKGIGVQREIVRSTLADSPGVIKYKDAPAEAGGWGATVVTLSVGPNQAGPEKS